MPTLSTNALRMRAKLYNDMKPSLQSYIDESKNGLDVLNSLACWLAEAEEQHDAETIGKMASTR